MATFSFHGLAEAGGRDWAPSVDVYRTSRGWVLKFDLAGVRPQDLAVEVSRSSVRVSGVRRDHILESDWRHYSMEISYCRFERVVPLPPVGLDGAHIASDYHDGMLVVRVETERKME